MISTYLGSRGMTATTIVLNTMFNLSNAFRYKKNKSVKLALETTI
jgi:hypothetical protein